MFSLAALLAVHLCASVGQPAPTDAPVAPVAPAPAAPASLASIIDALGSSDFATRDAASGALEARDDLALADLEAALARPDLSPEQQARLRHACWARFAKTPRGAIGVSFGGRVLQIPQQAPNQPQAFNQPPAFVIGELHPGFPARDKGLLKVGDIILKVDGHAVDTLTRNPVRPHIISRDPGDVVPMEILRNNETMQVLVELGSFNTLPAIRLAARDELSEADLREAWRVRTDRRQAAAPAHAAEVVVRVPDAKAADTESALVLESNARDRAAEGHWPGVLPGGQPRPGDEATQVGTLEGQWGANGMFVPARRPVDDEARITQLVSALLRQRDDRQANIDELERAMRDKALRPDIRREVMVKRDAYRVERDVLDLQIRRQREQLDLLRQQRRVRP